MPQKAAAAVAEAHKSRALPAEAVETRVKPALLPGLPRKWANDDPLYALVVATREEPSESSHSVREIDF